MKMDLTEFLLVFVMLWKITSGLRCYKCEAFSEFYDQPLCEHFDYSAKFLKDCDSSSMCYKRITTSQFGNEEGKKGQCGQCGNAKCFLSCGPACIEVYIIGPIGLVIITSSFYARSSAKIYERGCAQQTLDGYQERQNGRWIKVNKINEVYAEGCVESPGDEERVTRTEHCYCRGDLCNGVSETRRSVFAMEYKGVLSNIARMVAISVFAIGVSTLGMLVLR